MKYHRMLSFYRKQLDSLSDNFTPKEASEVGLDKGILTKLRHRGFLKRIQLNDGIFEWIKLYDNTR